MNVLEPTDHGAEQSLMLIFSVLAAGIVTAALGLLALLGWVLELPLLASFGANLMPMAPSTAVLFLLLGAAICLRARTPLSRRAFWVSVAVGCLGALAALLLFTLACLNIQWAVEHLGLNATRMVHGAPTGHMSPVTAFCFLAAGISFLASLSRSATRPWRAILALGSAGVLLGTCFIFLLAYLYGVPMLYGVAFIPPALNTVLAFIMLGLALLALAGRPAGLFGGSPGDGSRTAFAFILIFILLAAGIVTTGYIYYRSYEQKYRAEIERQLSSIAELKAGELTQYRNERLTDAAILCQNASISAPVRRFLERPEDEDAQRQLQAWLGKYQAHYQYDRAFLLDAQSVTRMAAPMAPEPVAALISQRVSEFLRSGQVAFQDFYRNEHNQHVYLALLVPILDESDAGRPLGVVVLRIDPAPYLYPFIQKWSAPSKTAETLLVRREGNGTLYLNDLRYRANAALALRLPLGKTDVPAVRAALGQTGIMQGVDYRAVPVIAAMRALSDSPWSPVAKMDMAEVYALLRERLWLTVFLVGVLLIGAGASASLLWRRQRVQFYKERAQAAEALRASEVQLRASMHLLQAIVDNTPALVYVLDREEHFLVANKAVGEFVGRPPAELLGKRRHEFLPQEIAERDEENDRQVIEAGGARQFEEPGTFEGRAATFLTVKFPLRNERGEIWGIGGVSADITERKRAEAALRESEARYRSLFDNMVEGFAYCRMLFEDGRPQDFIYLEVNEAFQTLTGLKNVVGRKVSDIIPGIRESNPELFERYGRVAMTGKPERFETYLAALNMWLSISMYCPEKEHFVAVFDAINERKRAEEALRELSLQLSRAEDAERRRIARELHDSTGQKLASLAMTVGLIQDAAGDPDGRTDNMFANCLAMIEECTQEIRTISYLLHPPLLDELGLAAAIRTYVEGFSKRSGVQVTLDAPPGLERFSTEVELALFRVVQESLVNIHRHGGASATRIRLACNAEQVTLEVSDQGRGMSCST